MKRDGKLERNKRKENDRNENKVMKEKVIDCIERIRAINKVGRRRETE